MEVGGKISAILNSRPSWRAIYFLCGGIVLSGCDGVEGAAEYNASSDAKSIGLVLSNFDYHFYVSEDGGECPVGFTHSSVEQWEAQFPSREQREAHFNRCGGVENRGPNCENVLAAPDLIKDPLPYREVKGTKSYGGNLDGIESEGDFVHPDGTKGIDNQYYRLLGCSRLVRAYALDPEVIRHKMIETFHLRTMLEIQGVDDERNDPYVEVIVYQGRDPLVVDGELNAVPWQTQRIEASVLPQRLRGRIANGELITEPAEIEWRDVAYLINIGDIFYAPPVLVRGTQLRLQLTETGAEGLRTGYVDADQWWRVRRSGHLRDSPPALHEALYRLADGYRDRETGRYTALSSATKLEFVRAYILHPDKEDESS